MVSPQVPQEEYPLTIASGGNRRRQGYFVELARGLSHASLAHKNPIKVAVVTEAGRTDEARLSDSMPRPSPFAATGLGRGLQANYEIWSGQLLLDRLQVPFLTRPRPAGRSQDKFAHTTRACPQCARGPSGRSVQHGRGRRLHYGR